MQLAYASILAFFVVAAGFMALSLRVSRWLAPNRPTGDKLETYECGEAPVGTAWFNFNPRFYVVALIFIVFDVEIAFVYPVAAVYRRWIAAGMGGVALAEILVFVGVLFLGLIYVWKRGDLEWVRAVRGGLPPLSVARSRAGESGTTSHPRAR